MKEKKHFSKLGFGLFFMALAVNVAQIIMMIITNEFFPDFINSIWYTWSFVGVGFYLIGFPVFLLCTKSIPKVETGIKENQSLGHMIKVFIICMSATYIFNIVGSLINFLIGLLKGSDVINPIAATAAGAGVWVTILFGVILSPIIEEIVFRGILLNRVREYGDKVAIVFTAIMFGLFHGNLSQFFYAVVLGMIFGYITIKSNTIRYSIILHVLVNFFGLVGVPALILSGNPLFASLGSIIVIVLLVTGLVLFIKNIKKVKLTEGLYQVSKKTIYTNAGVLSFIVICVIMFVMVIFTVA